MRLVSKPVSDILTVTRATSKWTLGPNGVYVETPPNTLAREWDANGNPKGALIEGSATNSITYSTKLDTTHSVTLTGVSGTFVEGETITGGTSGATAVVTDVSGSVLGVKSYSGTFSGGETVTGGTSGATGAFSSISTVWRVNNDTTLTASSDHYILEKGSTGYQYLDQRGWSASVGPTYCVGFAVKAGTLDHATILISSDSGSTIDGRVVFNLITLATSASGVNRVDHGIEPAEDGYYLIWVAASLTDTTNPGVFLYPGQYNESVAGNILVKRAQLETGTRPSSPIPTADSPVTRAADDVQRVLGSEYNDSGFTLLVGFGQLLPGAALFDFSGAGNSEFRLDRAEDGRFRFFSRNTDDESIFRSMATSGAIYSEIDSGGKLAVSHENGNYVIVCNGVVYSFSGAVASLGHGPTMCLFNRVLGGYPNSSDASRVNLYPYAMTNTQLQEATAQ